LSDGNVSDSKVERVRQEYERTLSRTEADLRHIIQSFDSLYSFSQIIYISDSSFKNSYVMNAQVVLEKGVLVERPIEQNLTDFVFCYFDYGDFKTLRLRHSEFDSGSSEYMHVQNPFPTKIKSASFFRNLFRPFLKNTH